MALLLLEERRRGRESPVWGYIEHLPQQFDTLLHWSEEELAELRYPALQQAVSTERASSTAHMTACDMSDAQRAELPAQQARHCSHCAQESACPSAVQDGCLQQD